jgi:toxin ParE1/3/4
LLADRIVNASVRLDKFPLSGRLVPEAKDEHVREIIVGNYRLIYRIFSDETEIVAVVHGARSLKPGDLRP